MDRKKINIKQYADSLGIKPSDLSKSLDIPKEELKKVLDNNLSDEDRDKILNTIDDLAKKKAIDASPESVPSKRYWNNSRRLKTLAPYKKHNPLIIDYMVAHDVKLYVLTGHFYRCNFAKRLRTAPLSKEQTAEVLKAIDKISADEKQDRTNLDVWGNPIRANEDLRKYKTGKQVSFSSIAIKMGITEKKLREMFSSEMADDEKKRIIEIIDQVYEYNNRNHED